MRTTGARHTQALCETAGTSLANVARAQIHDTNPNDVYPSFTPWRAAFPADPPAATLLPAQKPLLVPECAIVADWIAHVPA